MDGVHCDSLRDEVLCLSLLYVDVGVALGQTQGLVGRKLTLHLGQGLEPPR